MPRLQTRQAVTQPLDKPYRFIPLTQGQVAIVDLFDFEWLSQWHWNAHRNTKTGDFYASRLTGSKGSYIAMHRLILGCQPGELGDHKNGNTLDNRRDNLRKCTARQNACNAKPHRDRKSCRFKGVTRLLGAKYINKPWQGYIYKPSTSGRERIHLGYFATAEDAARAYDKAAKELHGEFAHLNFP